MSPCMIMQQSRLFCEHRVELAFFLERVKVVAAADMRGADEDLRKRAAAIRPLDHLVAQLAVTGRVDFLESHALARQEVPCRIRVVAEIARVNHHLGHVTPDKSSICGSHYMGAFAASTTRAKTNTSTWRAPARSKARAQAFDVAPEVSTSSIRIRLRPATSAFAPGATLKAPCTFAARSLRESPTCCAVALTRVSAACATAMPLAREMCSASAADWLKRRVHSRRQCSGTGTSASASPRRSRPACVIHSPLIGARSIQIGRAHV